MDIYEVFPPTCHAGAIVNFGEAKQIALALKGRPSGKGWIAKCPCHDDRTASLSLTEGEDGRLLMHCFAGCEFEDIKAVLRDRGIIGVDRLDRGRRALATYVKPTPTEHKPDARSSLLWNSSAPVHGTLAQKYLERRGILIMPPTLRYHIGSRAMIAALQRPDGKPVAVQATFLTMEGEKASNTPKRTYGSMRDGAVRLAAAAGVMGLAEGIETGLSVMAMSGVPVWVSLGCKRLHDVLLPELVREVHVFGDNDAPGRAAAHRAADVHLRAGRHVVLRFPPDGVNDFNDLLTANADRELSVAA